MSRDEFIETTREKMLKDISGVSKDRHQTYGPAYDSFQRIGTMWEAYYKSKYGMDIPVTPTDVAFLMNLFKMCREFNKHHLDNGTDGSNYFAFGVAFNAWEEFEEGMELTPWWNEIEGVEAVKDEPKDEPQKEETREVFPWYSERSSYGECSYEGTTPKNDILTSLYHNKKYIKHIAYDNSRDCYPLRVSIIGLDGIKTIINIPMLPEKAKDIGGILPSDNYSIRSKSDEPFEDILFSYKWGENYYYFTIYGTIFVCYENKRKIVPKENDETHTLD